MFVSRVTLVAAVIQILAIHLDSSKVVAFLTKGGELFDGSLMLGIAGLLFAEGNDPCDRLPATQEDEAFTRFNFRNARGEILIGFTKGYATHKCAPGQLYY